MRYSRRNFLKISGLTVSATGFATKLFAEEKSSTTQQLQDMVAGVKPLNEDDYRKRIEKAKKLMAENKIDALLLTGSTNLRYFTNTNWGRSERVFGAVLNTKGDPVWVCPGFEKERAEERIIFGNDIRTWEEHESPYSLIAGIMKDLGKPGGRLGIGPTVRNFVIQGLRNDSSAGKLDLADGSVITDGCRVIKTEKEIGYMDLANKITKLAYREGFSKFADGMSSRELSGLIRNAHSKMGVSGGGFALFGQNSAFPHGTNIRRDLREGSIVLVDGGCGVEGFRADVTRTVVYGKPSDRQRKVWDVVRKAQLAAHNVIRPGVPCEEIDKAARKVVEDEGFGPDYKYFTHRVGHGIGMEGHEYSYLVRGNKLKLQPGMTFSNEPGIYIYGEFGVRLEDCFVVTETGAKILGGMESSAIDKPFGG